MTIPRLTLLPIKANDLIINESSFRFAHYNKHIEEKFRSIKIFRGSLASIILHLFIALGMLHFGSEKSESILFLLCFTRLTCILSNVLRSDVSLKVGFALFTFCSTKFCNANAICHKQILPSILLYVQ